MQATAPPAVNTAGAMARTQARSLTLDARRGARRYKVNSDKEDAQWTELRRAAGLRPR